MAVIYTDCDIESFIHERKPLPSDWRGRLRMRPKPGHHERRLDVTGDAGSAFRLILRQNSLNALDFSVILAVVVPQSNQVFRLRRYNGRSHEHTNHIEDETFYDFHVHLATQRYQELGPREDAYAERTDRYGDFRGALSCLLTDAKFDTPPEPQGDLFEGNRNVH